MKRGGWMGIGGSLLATMAWTSTSGGPVPQPPENPKRPVVDQYHGRQIVDFYRWLEGDISDPATLGKLNTEVDAWTVAQNQYTRSILDSLPGRRPLEERLRPLLEIDSISLPEVRGERLFYFKRQGNQSQPVLYLREGLRGAERVLIDPKVLDPSGLTTIALAVPSPDGKLVAYGAYRAGDEITVLRVRDVERGVDLEDTIPNKVSECAWLPDGTGLFYRNLAQADNPYSGQVRFHRLGRPQSEDPLVFRQLTPEENRELATTWGPGFDLSEDGNWLGLSYYTGTDANDYWVAPVRSFLEGGKVERIPILVGERARTSGLFSGDTLLLLTTFGAPQGRVVAVDLQKPERSNWKTLVPERPKVTIQSVELAQGVLVVEVLENVSSRLELYRLDGSRIGEIPLPTIGSAQALGWFQRNEVFVSFSSFHVPPTVYRIDLAQQPLKLEVWERPAVPVDSDSIEVRQEWYVSRDGTRVPMFLVHRKGLARDGQRPTLLTGYGGFNISLTPSFNATLFPWFEAGGVLAVANLRGGGEFGEAWHRAGMLEKKQNVFDDFVAAAEFLIRSGYTKADRLAIRGGSNGGLLTGAAIVQRPELFRAAIVAVPLLDMLRYEKFLMARYWVPEYGSAENREQFDYLVAYSPYHQVREGERYPAVFLTAGENDTRVHPFHARKMAARLQEVARGVEGARPVLLWVDREAGHGQGKPLEIRLRETVDLMTFLFWQLGVALPDTKGAS